MSPAFGRSAFFSPSVHSFLISKETSCPSLLLWPYVTFKNEKNIGHKNIISGGQSLSGEYLIQSNLAEIGCLRS